MSFEWIAVVIVLALLWAIIREVVKLAAIVAQARKRRTR
jgi:hypothetical protein